MHKLVSLNGGTFSKLKVVYTMWTTEEAKKGNVWLAKTIEELTPLIF